MTLFPPFFCIIDTLHFTYISYRLFFSLWVHLISHVIMTVMCPNSTCAPSNSHLDLKLNLSLNPETTVHDDMYNVKYQ